MRVGTARRVPRPRCDNRRPSPFSADMTRVLALQHSDWYSAAGPAIAANAQPAIEAGDVLFCPELRFTVELSERSLFTPAILGSAKNASYDPAADRLGGTTVTGGDRDSLKTLMRRFSDAALACVDRLLPLYRGRLTRARASFRPAEIAGRATTWRKDDTRLHVDSFPATPSGGRRILRLFTNVNPDGHPRSWRIGDEFEAVARRFADRAAAAAARQRALLALVRVTKTPRSAVRRADAAAARPR